jgi:hypothetical protein
MLPYVAHSDFLLRGLGWGPFGCVMLGVACLSRGCINQAGWDLRCPNNNDSYARFFSTSADLYWFALQS